MAGNLYQVLEINDDATPEQIRKAYKKRALQTHPDRLPPGASATEKASAEEQFRKVNNAYEVLNNPQNRKIYDTHGEWPPPKPSEEPRRSNHGGRYHYPGHHHHHRHHHHHQSFNDASDPFFDPSDFRPFSRRPHSHFTFTDPFMLFNSIFGDMRDGRPHFYHHRSNSQSLWQDEPSLFSHDPQRTFRELDSFMDGFGGMPRQRAFPTIGSNVPPTMVYHQSESFNYPGSGGWTSESRMTSTVNGVTQTVWKRRDSDGNEHITRTYPDGRETYTVNGIEQSQPGSPGGRYISSGLPVFPAVHRDCRHLPGSQNYVPPPPPPNSYASPPPYSSGHNMYSPSDYHRRPDTSPVIPDSSRHHSSANPDSDSKRRWWRRPGW